MTDDSIRSKRAPSLPVEDRLALRAAAEALWPAMVMFRDEDRPAWSASGFLVLCQGRTVIATAAHVAAEYKHRHRMVIAFLAGVRDDRLTNTDYARDAHDWCAARDYENGEPDVGLVVLRHEVVAARPGLRSLDFAALKPCPTNDDLKGRGLFFFGAPAKATVSVAGGVIGQVQVYNSTVVQTFGRDLQHYCRYLQVEWDQVTSPSGACPEAPIHPGGMSGGPIFATRAPADGELWSVKDHVYPIGIAVQVQPEENCILAERLECWANYLEQVRTDPLVRW